VTLTGPKEVFNRPIYIYYMAIYILLAHLAEGHESLRHGAASVRRQLFPLKWLLLKNHKANFNQTWQETCLEDGDSDLFK